MLLLNDDAYNEWFAIYIVTEAKNLSCFPLPSFQLLHLKTNKYLTVNRRYPAKNDKLATQVYLDKYGTEDSWFQILPFYKHRNLCMWCITLCPSICSWMIKHIVWNCWKMKCVVFKGDPVGADDQVILASGVNAQQCLHLSDVALSDANEDRGTLVYEVNSKNRSDREGSSPAGPNLVRPLFVLSKLSSQNVFISGCFPFPQFSSLTPWRLMLFLNFEENIPAKLKGGDVVRLFHVHEGKFLTLDAPQSEPGRQYIFLRTTLRASATTAVSSNALWEVEVRSLVFFNSSAVIYVNYVNC